MSRAVDADGGVAGGVVQAGGEAASGRADEVDLHIDGHRPGQALVQAEQDVGGDDPAPGRCVGGGEGGGDAEQPADHEELLATEPGGEGLWGGPQRVS